MWLMNYSKLYSIRLNSESKGKYKLEAFNNYGIPSFVLNEDMPYDPVIWKVYPVCIHIFVSRYNNDLQALKKGTSTFKNIFWIYAAEQFFPIRDGHIPPLARLLKIPSFTKSIGLFFDWWRTFHHNRRSITWEWPSTLTCLWKTGQHSSPTPGLNSMWRFFCHSPSTYQILHLLWSSHEGWQDYQN